MSACSCVVFKVAQTKTLPLVDKGQLLIFGSINSISVALLGEAVAASRRRAAGLNPDVVTQFLLEVHTAD